MEIESEQEMPQDTGSQVEEQIVDTSHLVFGNCELCLAHYLPIYGSVQQIPSIVKGKKSINL